MAVIIIANFNALNSGYSYDNITIFFNTTTQELTCDGNTQDTYNISEIYGYSPLGTVLHTYTVGGLNYAVYAGNPYATDVYETPFAYTAPYTPDEPGSCDIAFLAIFTTDETIALNDGTISASATSSYSGIEFSINGTDYFSSGNFTGLAPGTYTVYAKDSNGCTITNEAVILAYDDGPAVYNERYYIEYSSSQNDDNIFRVSFKQKGWTGSTTRLKPGASACTKSYLNGNEDKYEPIIPSVLNIGLINDGTFVMSDFYSNDEREWKIEEYVRISGADSTFNLRLVEADAPSFIDGNVILRFNGVVNDASLYSTGNAQATGIDGQSFSIEFQADITSSAPDPKITGIVKKNGEIVFAQTLPHTNTVSMVYSGTNDSSCVYEAYCYTQSGGDDVNPVNIPDSITGAIDFKGWLIPDEIQDYYKNSNYEITLIATDGLESLRGFQYLDDDSYPILGKKKLTEILQFCLAKLDYTATKRIICSIVSEFDGDADYQYPNTYLWSDAFYDQDLNAFDCYQVIYEINKTFGWSLKQVDGNFIFSLANDLNKTSGDRIITEYDENFEFIEESTNFPVLKSIGIGQDYLPVNPDQNVRYDKALPKVSVTHDFGGYSIVNTNRSFEVGAVEDGTPPGWTFTVIGPPGYNTYKLKQVTYAYSGLWVYRASGNSYTGTPMSVSTIANSPAIPVTKTGQKVSVSLSYLCVSPSDQGVPRAIIYIEFRRTSDSEVFLLASDGKWYPEATPTPPGITISQELQSQYKDEWNSFTSPDSIDKSTAYTNEIPGLGDIYIRLVAVNAYDLSGNILPTGPDAALAYIDYDDLDITLAPIDDRNNPLVGETWNIINKTKVFLGQPRDLDIILYDQPNNEYLNGNIFFNDTITNKWSVIGKPYTEASIGKILPIEIQANYQRPAVIWEGDIIADDVDMNMVFEVYGYPGKVFMPISMTHAQRDGIVTLLLKEIIDDTLIFDFQYIPKYSRNSRTIIS